MFRRSDEERHEPIEPREVRRREGPGDEITVVGRGARLEGTVVSAGSLRIEGNVKGKITAEGDVILAPSSEVEADIQARSVTVGGRFKGNITVAGKAEVAREGRVEGNIRSKVLVVVEGAVFNGQSIMDSRGGAHPERPEAPAAARAEAPGQPQPSPVERPGPQPEARPPGGPAGPG
ncbi:MAG TPA: polymer-forming cytoskeletal protein, partial [Actinomycetota bacterium]|nr:polymer-forming cytoskeletal protein [Actinomycetota bacterium]